MQVQTQLSHHEQRIANTEDDIQRIQRSNDIRITDIPLQENENLLAIYEQIASEIGFNTSYTVTPSIERIFMKNRMSGQIAPSGTIMLHFVLPKHKQLFYSCYLNKMLLNPLNFGLPATSRIVIGENLTATNANIFRLAHQLKNQNKIAQVSNHITKYHRSSNSVSTAQLTNNSRRYHHNILCFQMTPAPSKIQHYHS